jgi:hypothetical protein
MHLRFWFALGKIGLSITYAKLNKISGGRVWAATIILPGAGFLREAGPFFKE